MELFRDHFARDYEIRKGRAVLSRCASLAAARAWLRLRGTLQHLSPSGVIRQVVGLREVIETGKPRKK